MNSFGAYFKRHFLSTWVRPVVFTILGLIPILTKYIEANNNYVDSGATLPHTLFDSITVIVCIVAVITPILEFATFNNKRNLDTIFSLPISKTKVLMAHYVTGITHIVITITVVYIAWLIAWVYAPFTLMNEAYVFIFYPLVLLASICVYTVYSFVFLQANTIIDGCIFMYLHTFVPMIILYWISSNNIDVIPYHNNLLLKNMSLSGSHFALPIILNRLFNYVSIPDYISYVPIEVTFRDFQIYRYEIALIWLFVILTIISFILMIICFNKKSPANAGNISNSWFGYKTLGPIHSILGGFSVKDFLESLFSGFASLLPLILILVPIITFLGYMVYRRGIKLKWVDIIIITMSVTLIF
ncbi:MAG: hypothetical protein E7312_06935 [Clostridiales bacterium]|nr:hypothetical protein [Clostridiales bacterium]